MRVRAGRPEGRTKQVITASVDKEVIALVKAKHTGNLSQLVERLFREYLKRKST